MAHRNKYLEQAQQARKERRRPMKPSPIDLVRGEDLADDTAFSEQFPELKATAWGWIVKPDRQEAL